MRIVIQRVTKASVTTDDQQVKIGKGLLIFLGVTATDNHEDLQYLESKIVNLRIFADEKGLMNRSILDIKGEVLVVSQFTLYARTRKGNRPSFIDAAKPDFAKKMYQLLIEQLKEKGLRVKSGLFGAYMQVALINDGPITMIIDSSEKPRN